MFIYQAICNHSYLYWLCHAQDANFRLKSRFRQTSVEDVCLSPGWGCFVEHRDYLAHVSKFANQEEVCLPLIHYITADCLFQISTCAGFQTLHLANLKKMRGLSATGVAGCICSRHEMWRTLGDLQKGERYVITKSCIRRNRANICAATAIWITFSRPAC